MTHPSLPLRLTVTSSTDSGGDDAWIRLLEAGDTFGWQIEGSTETMRKAVEEIAQAAIETLEGAEISLGQVVQALDAALDAAGYDVLIAADEPLRVTGTFDMRTARMLTRGDTDDADLLRGIHWAIKEGFRFPGMELKKAVTAAIASGDIERAIRAVEDAVRQGNSAFFGNDPDLFAAIDQVPDEFAKGRPDFLKARLALGYGLKAWKQLERDARFYLVSANPDVTGRGTIENTIAAALSGQGMKEAARSEWRRLLRTPGALSTSDRGWAWRNLAKTLSPASTEALSAARASVDAFLEAGDKIEAMASQVMVGELLLQSDTDEALRHFETLRSDTALMGDLHADERAAIHHHSANCMNQLRRYDEALFAAKAAIAEHEALIGAEDQLVSSLHLAAMLARDANKPEEADVYDARVTALVAAGHSPHFTKVAPVMELLEVYDGGKALAALADARAREDKPTVLALEALIATQDPDLSHADRIVRLERTLQSNAEASPPELRSPRLALAFLLEAEEDYAAAAVRYRQILDHEPSALEVRDRLIGCLESGGLWSDLATFLRAEFSRSRSGGIGLAWVGACMRGGDPKGALAAAQIVLSAALLTAEQSEQLDRDRLRAMDLGGVFEAAAPQTPLSPTIGRAEIEEALGDFSRHVTGDVRMSFWRASDKKRGDHVWCVAPEQNGQNLLHTFLRGRFKDRINAFQEVAAGAGRIDLLLQFDEALQVVIELKLCGYGYSADYAAGGSDQLDHYMRAHNFFLGYLLVFDARLNDYGQGLNVITPAQGTIKSYLIDVRPRVAKRKSGGKA